VLAHARLPWLDFTHLDLKGSIARANFSAADLRCAKFGAVKFVAVDFKWTDLRASEISGANFDVAEWKGAICPDGTLADDHGSTCAEHLTAMPINGPRDVCDSGHWPARPSSVPPPKP
jgi:uncharacterized protein YjbI with pentapeptide repeats